MATTINQGAKGEGEQKEEGRHSHFIKLSVKVQQTWQKQEE